MTDAKRLQGYFIAFISTAFWSTTAVLISYLNTRFRMPPLVLAFWRDFLAACTLAGTLALFARGQLHLGRQHLPFFVLYGFLLAIFTSLWIVSVALNGAAVATALIYVSPAFTAVMEWRRGGVELNALRVAAIALSILGCVLVSGAYQPSVWQLNPQGIISGVGTGLAFTLYSLLGKASSGRGVKPWTATLYTFAFGSAFLLLAQRPETFFWLSRPLGSDAGGWREAALGWGAILALAVGPTLGGYGLYTVSLTYLTATTANLIVTLEPAITAGLAFLLLGDRLSLAQLLGGAAIMTGVLVLRLGERRKPAPDLSAG
ncbi:MAG: EamA family transporter [Anaerolineae bacterium]